LKRQIAYSIGIELTI